MKPRSGFFLADGILALAVILIGTGAILAIQKATIRARYDHQIRQHAWRILRHAPSWAPNEAALPWERAFDFHGEPVSEGGVIWLKANGETSGQLQKVRFEIAFFDSSGVKRTFWLNHNFWEVDHAGL